MAQTNGDLPAERLATYIPLERLDLDAANPRFGGLHAGATQNEILDHIVTTFGVDDVLSSLAVNGYFRAEPLVGRTTTGSDRVTIAEGNRRLAACLILASDPRARAQRGRIEQYQEIWRSHGSPAIDPIPVITFGRGEQTHALLSYLGVRHIAASQPWDSYAKAAWVSTVVANNDLTVPEVSQMIGDQHRTVSRLLEGYYFIQQAISCNVFRPSDSVRSGRGSVTAYPFSWVYTILGYASARQFLGLRDDGPRQNPIPPSSLNRAGLVLQAMFGNKTIGRNSAVLDSRELGDLAAALASSEKVALLEQGVNLREIIRRTKPIDERLRQGFATIRDLQREILAGLSELPVPEETAANHVNSATMIRRSASEIEKKLRLIITPDLDEL